MYHLMQIAMMRDQLRLGPSEQRHVDDMLVHEGAQRTFEFLREQYVALNHKTT